MIIVGGKERKELTDARALNSTLKRFHVRMPRDKKEKAEQIAWRQANKDLFLIERNTTLQGTKLLQGALHTDEINQFIELRLTNKADDIPSWHNRESR